MALLPRQIEEREMSESKIKPATMWAIYNNSFGFYIGTQLTRHEAIHQHETDLGRKWEHCRAMGDSAVKVRIMAIEHAEASK